MCIRKVPTKHSILERKLGREGGEGREAEGGGKETEREGGGRGGGGGGGLKEETGRGNGGRAEGITSALEDRLC